MNRRGFLGRLLAAAVASKVVTPDTVTATPIDVIRDEVLSVPPMIPAGERYIIQTAPEHFDWIASGSVAHPMCRCIPLGEDFEEP